MKKILNYLSVSTFSNFSDLNICIYICRKKKIYIYIDSPFTEAIYVKNKICIIHIFSFNNKLIIYQKINR